MELKKLDTVSALREEIDRAPQLKLQIVAAISQILAQHGVRATGTVLGSLNVASLEELEKLGILPAHVRASQWTI